ncbi:methyltransferase domain-containing protein [Desulfosporosinus sp. PR]|uniref:class I SAM-dependent methyltransferase n=1 Tax=Candidatus Desulfosporosinus nitrosoreducens TaxID=3401928 RepID=UPI0027FB67C2|nr:methyltransferase domain-containing protein [Desulfosporosinus sp. PR]MDQ7093540.1 methyltransferase domain-containing protein [Desulfosporosinus sp. PR]
MSFMRNARKKRDIPITGFMAKWYDKNTRGSRILEMKRYADLVSEATAKGAQVLEVAPGPGFLAIELARRGFVVTGVELSEDFVAIEKKNAQAEGVSVEFKQGNASDLPLPEGKFDFVVCSAAFKNFSKPLKALDEMYRVLKPGGIALVLDMNRENTPEDIEEEMQNYPDMKGFDRFFVKFSFKTFLRNGAYSQKEFQDMIAETRFARSEIKKYGIGFQVWLYK